MKKRLYLQLILLTVIVALSVKLTEFFVSKVVLFSEVDGQIFLHGKPLAHALVIQTTEYQALNQKTTSTDEQGYFHFDEKQSRKKFNLFPTEFVVAQSIKVKTDSHEYQIWSNTKRQPEVNSELGGKSLNLVCNLEDGLKIYKNFGSVLRTNCRWHSDLKSNSSQLFVLSEHLDSLDWMKQLPNGVLSETIDLQFNSVTIDKNENGVVIYVGTKTPENGGSGVTVWLDTSLNLVNYEIEQLEPDNL